MEHENLVEFLKNTNFAERGFNDFRSLKSALKILETIAKAVKKLPIGPGTVERLADHEELQPYIVNAIDDVINVTHEDMCHMVTVQFGENAYWLIEYNNWQDQSIGSTPIALGDLAHV